MSDTKPAAPRFLLKMPEFLRRPLSAFSSSSFFIQLFCLIIFLGGVHYFYENTVENLTRQHIASGFGFLNMRAGISIPDSLIPYSPDSPYKTALLAGLVNTVFMSALCIFTATLLGFLLGIGRLGKNWLLRKLCSAYVEIFRNIPVLLVILFFYFGVLQQYLPPVRDSISLPLHIYINQRGAYFPSPAWTGGLWGKSGFALPCLLFALAFLCFCGGRFLTERGGRRRGFLPLFMAAAAACAAAALYCLWQGLSGQIPQKGLFNIVGGSSISPEFLALFLGLSCYTSALVSETVRAGLQGVDKGLQEAGASLGLKPGMVFRFVTVPLALRIIVPPLASQYMNAAKNTSLAVAIGYSDLMRIGNTVLIQTNQSVEVVLIWIIAYLALCLIISALMNALNYRLLYAERQD